MKFWLGFRCSECSKDRFVDPKKLLVIQLLERACAYDGFKKELPHFQVIEREEKSCHI
jgi:hypothetical protein